MNNWLYNFADTVNAFMLDFALLILLCGTSVYFTFRLKFVQIRKFKQGLKAVFGGFDLNGDKAGADGMSSFQSLATAIAAQVGTGNISGAATAIAAGGPGAIFWMWLSAFFGMATNYAEATIAQVTRTRVDGAITGGPVYYIQKAFDSPKTKKFGKFLAVFFSGALILALGPMGSMVQSNSVGSSFKIAFGLDGWIIGVVVAIAAAFIFLGGVSSIASITEKIVPIMAAVYMLGSVVVIAFNWQNIGNAFAQIFIGAFNPQAVMGGMVGVSVKTAIRYGVARGLFSNEAGMGSTPHAHAMAKVKHPCDQGTVAITAVFIDTFIVLTLTALVIISTGSFTTGKTGTALAQHAYNTVFGSFGNIFIAVCMLFFAFSTIIGWYFFGETNVKYLFGKKAVKPYAILVSISIVLGTLMDVTTVWELADMFNGLMVIPNLIALLALSGLICKVSKTHDEGKAWEREED